jgi:hypothetical protein
VSIVCRGCHRALFRRWRWTLWRDPYGDRLCAYRASGLLPHKPGAGLHARIGSPAGIARR